MAALVLATVLTAQIATEVFEEKAEFEVRGAVIFPEAMLSGPPLRT
jgi:hypothetical protein